MDNVFVPSTWKRIFAHLIDQFIRLFFYVPFVKTFYLLIFTDDPVHFSLFQLLVFLLIPALYELIFLVLMQATPGKWMLGLKVVPFYNPNEKLELQQCILRPVVKLLSFFFSDGIYALAFFRYDRTHIADWVAETRVIQFTPRASRPKIRWFLGVLLIFIFTTEGLKSAKDFLSVVNFRDNTVNVRALFDADAFREMIDEQTE